jgi:hypothetical protein
VLIPRKESNATKRISTTPTVLPSTNMGAVGKAYRGVLSAQPLAEESEAKATADLSLQTGTAEAQIEVSEPAAVVAEVEPRSADVTAPPAIVSVDAVPVEITETVTVVVPGQKSEDIEDVEITGTEPEHGGVASSSLLWSYRTGADRSFRPTGPTGGAAAVGGVSMPHRCRVGGM